MKKVERQDHAPITQFGPDALRPFEREVEASEQENEQEQEAIEKGATMKGRMAGRKEEKAAIMQMIAQGLPADEIFRHSTYYSMDEIKDMIKAAQGEDEAGWAGGQRAWAPAVMGNVVVGRRVEAEDTEPIIAAYDESDIIEGEVHFLVGNILENEHIIDDEILWDQIKQLGLEGLSEDDIIAKLQEAGVYDQVEKAAQESAYQNSDVFQDAWDNEADLLGETLAQKSPTGLWHVEGHNLGWQRRSGEKDVVMKNPSDGKEFLSAVLPNTNQLSYKVWDDGAGISMTVWYHDAPTGSNYTAQPGMAEEEPAE